MSLPQLSFRLAGRWHRVDLSDQQSIRATARAVALEIAGRRDQDAPARARLRADLVDAADQAVAGGATMLMFSTELTPGTPMPVTLTVYVPERLRMSPAVGTDPATVLTTFVDGLEVLDPDAHASLQEAPYDGGTGVRTHRLTDQVHEESDRSVTIRRLSVDYWLPVPGTKRLALVNLATPLGEIAEVMLSFFDAIISAVWFDDTRIPVASRTPASIADRDGDWSPSTGFVAET